MRFAVVFTSVLVPILAANPCSANNRAALFASKGKALKGQLACLKPLKPALAIRAMIGNSLIAKTNFGADGSPVFRPTSDLQVFGAKVLFVTRWEMEGDRVKEPFWRGPGSALPLFLSVVVDALPVNVTYREHVVRGSDGIAVGSFSTMGATQEYYAKSGTTITCYGGWGRSRADKGRGNTDGSFLALLAPELPTSLRPTLSSHPSAPSLQTRGSGDCHGTPERESWDLGYPACDGFGIGHLRCDLTSLQMRSRRLCLFFPYLATGCKGAISRPRRNVAFHPPDAPFSEAHR